MIKYIPAPDIDLVAVNSFCQEFGGGVRWGTALSGKSLKFWVVFTVTRHKVRKTKIDHFYIAMLVQKQILYLQIAEMILLASKFCNLWLQIWALLKGPWVTRKTSGLHLETDNVIDISSKNMSCLPSSCQNSIKFDAFRRFTPTFSRPLLSKLSWLLEIFLISIWH